ncbi:MAG: hypothetical protein ACYTGW_13575 [Planctomycetota bacterium]
MATTLAHVVASLSLATLSLSSLSAQITPARWTTVVAGKSASGTIGSTSFTMTFAAGAGTRQGVVPWSITNSVDYTNNGNTYGKGQYVCAAMGSNPANHLTLSQKDNFTLTFAKPVKDLVVYLASWRRGTFDCSAPFSIASGLVGSTTTVAAGTGNFVLVTPATSTPQYGALRFTNITTLTIKDTSGRCCSGMWFTLGSGAASTPGCARVTPYGKGCAGMSMTSDRPISGTTMKVTLGNMPTGTALCGLLIGAMKYDPGLPIIPAPIATNCLQFTTTGIIVVFKPQGTQYVAQFALPATLAVGARAYAQGIAATQTHLGSSNGLEFVTGKQ